MERVGCSSWRAGDYVVIPIIRPALTADIPFLPDIERSAGSAFRSTAHAWIADDQIVEAEAYPPLIAANQVQVAEVDGVLAGLLIVEKIDTSLHIHEISVAEPFQKQGLGRALMLAARRKAQALGCREMTLTTFSNVTFNAPFYASLGFGVVESPTHRLAAILAAETAHGLTDRCAMLAPV